MSFVNFSCMIFEVKCFDTPKSNTTYINNFMTQLALLKNRIKRLVEIVFMIYLCLISKKHYVV